MKINSTTTRWIAMLLIAALTLSFTSTAAFAAHATLRSGSTGSAVKNLQTMLNAVDNTGLAVDGHFGPATLQAVKNYQSSRKLGVDGIVGPATWSSLEKEYNKSSAQPTTHSIYVYDGEEYMSAVKDCPVRTKASNKASVLGTLKKSSVIKIIGSTTNSAGNLWYKTRINNTTYYIYSGNLSKADTNSAQLLRVTTKNAALRAGPYETHPIVAKLRVGQIVRCMGSIVNEKYDNTWWIIKDDHSKDLNFLYSKNATKKYSGTDGDLSLDVAACRQTTDWSCSGAAFAAIVTYYNPNLAGNVSDTWAANACNTYVYRLTDLLNDWLPGQYRWNEFNSYFSYEQAIRTSLAQGSPVIARIAIPDRTYFNYTSSGHYSTITSCYEQNGEVWVTLADSYAQRFTSTTHANASTGLVNIPLRVLFNYGDYGNTSPVYLIYND